ncbi:unnamed protein product, partial [Mesocestoides corti]
MSVDYKGIAGNEDLMKRLFNKVYSAIISEKIFCPPETAVYLAAYACQAKFGPAQALRNPVPPVKELLPKSTIDNHNLTITEWENRISNWHLKLRDTPFLDAIVEYLDIAQDVELYGASIFEVETASQVRKWISLDAVGLNIYDSKRKPPTTRHVWSDIASFTAWDEKIEIVMAHEPKQVIEFFVMHPQTSNLLVNLFQGSKELYSRRRKGEISSKYLRRSESNSSMRMRPHKLAQKELTKLEQQITELELELPRQATGFEYAAWQVKDQLRQARGIEVKLSLNAPSTEETRRLQHRVAQIRVFLEQDIFKEKAIRIGGAFSDRLDGYTSDIDSGPEFSSVVRVAPPQPAAPQRAQLNSGSSSSDNEDHGYVDHPISLSRGSKADPPVSSMPPLPKAPAGTNQRHSQHTPLDASSTRQTDNLNTTPSFNPDTYPKLPDRYQHTLDADEPSRTMTTTFTNDGPGYPEARGSEEMDPPASVSSPDVWKHVLRTSGQDANSPYTRGRMHGQVIEPETNQLAYRPPVQPKPKVAPRATADPQMVIPEPYTGGSATSAAGQDLKFSSLKVTQTGFAKK